MYTMRSFLLATCLVASCAASPKAPVAPVKVDTRVPIAASVQVRVDAWAKLSEATSGQTVEANAAEDLPWAETRASFLGGSCNRDNG